MNNNYGLETVVSVVFSNTRTRLLYNEREIFNTECSIEHFDRLTMLPTPPA